MALPEGRHHDVDRYLERHPLGDVKRIASLTGSREGRLRALSAVIVESEAELVVSVNIGDIEHAVDRVRRAGSAALRLVVTQHGLQRDFYDHLRANANLVDGVIVTNRLSEELAVTYSGIERARVAYAPYGVDRQVEERPSRADEKLRIAWVGRLEQAQKRVHDLEGIVRRLEALGVDFLICIAGSGPEQNAIRESLAPFFSGGRVRFQGEVASERMSAEVYEMSDVLLVTSSWETGPIVAWEALASGLAIVSSRFLGIGREASLRDGETALLFPVGDVTVAASQLARLRDSELRRRLVVAGQAEVRARYTLRASLEAWERALRFFAGLTPRVPVGVPSRVAAAGRLDRWLGPKLAETARSALGIRHPALGPGDEWPHVRVVAQEDSKFSRLALELDDEAATEASGRP